MANGLPYHPLVGAGELRNPSSDLCLDKNDRTEFMDHPLDVLPCHGLAGYQYWWMNKNRFYFDLNPLSSFYLLHRNPSFEIRILHLYIMITTGK